MKKILVIIGMLVVIMKLDAQNVGIGTTDPLSNLHVVGEIRSDSMYVADRFGIGTDTPDRPLTIRVADQYIMGVENSSGVEKWLWWLYSNKDLALASDSVGNVFYATQNGNVGLGTFYPQAKLHLGRSLGGGYANDFLILQNYEFGGAGIKYVNPIVNSQPWQSYIDNVGAFRIGRHGMGDFVSILSNGLLGIGTPAPAYRLDVQVYASNSTLAQFRSNGGYANILVGNSTKSATIGADDLGGYVGTISPDDLRFTINGTTCAILRSDSGHFGIGTEQPNYRLDAQVQSTFATVAQFKTLGGDADILVQNGVQKLSLGVNDAGGYIRMRTGHDLHIQTNYTTRLFIDDGTGNVGVGIYNPEQKLDVNGNIKIAGVILNESVTAPTLLNNWINYDAGFETAGFFIDKFGMVHLKGLVCSGTSAHIMTLPEGYRPTGQLLFTVVSGNGFARIDVKNNGDVTLIGMYSSDYVSLSGIAFRIEEE